jgi:hypothetical protein
MEQEEGSKRRFEQQDALVPWQLRQMGKSYTPVTMQVGGTIRDTVGHRTQKDTQGLATKAASRQRIERERERTQEQQMQEQQMQEQQMQEQKMLEQQMLEHRNEQKQRKEQVGREEERVGREEERGKKQHEQRVQEGRQTREHTQQQTTRQTREHTQQQTTQQTREHTQQQTTQRGSIQVFQRYCHMYREGELESLCEQVGGAVVLSEHCSKQRSNWQVVMRKQATAGSNSEAGLGAGTDGGSREGRGGD